MYSRTLHLPFELISGQTIQPAKQIILFLEVQSAENCFVTKETVDNETKKGHHCYRPNAQPYELIHVLKNTDYCEFETF